MFRAIGRILAACVLLCAGSAQAQVVISQAYVAGGEPDATYQSDFIELHNIGQSPIDLTGWSVQYADATSTVWQRTLLSGSIPGGGYLLVPAFSSGNIGAALPQADASPGFAMSAAAGKIALVKNQELLIQNCITSPSQFVADFVGYGAADCAEYAPTSAPPATTAIGRFSNGCTDINNNVSDFTFTAPNPKNSQTAPQLCNAGPLPFLSISDASAAEGNGPGWTNSAVLEVTLNTPAPRGGVRFNVSTSNGTATAGFSNNPATDYFTQNWSVVIPEGAISQSFLLPIVGDTLYEADETVLLSITDIQGAVSIDNVGVYTIVNDDPYPVEMTIAQVQGTGRTSAFVGQDLTVEGIVTARRANDGFFLQSVNDDGNPATSEGIFVSTVSAPPASAAIGNRVRVVGRVTEFTPSNDLSQLSVTQIVAPTIQVLASGVDLPAPVALTSADFGAASVADTAEKYEGMRVSVATARVTEGTGATINEFNASATSNGEFFVVLADVARPFRELGIGVLDRIAIPADKNPPRFDINPERLMVRSRGQIGGIALDVNVDAEINDLNGVLDYARGTWALLPDPSATITANGGKQPRAVIDARGDDITVANMNLRRFWDDIDDGNDNFQLTPVAFDRRLNKISAAICDYLKAPDILGVQEVEHLAALQALADRINNSCPRAPAYQAYLIPSVEADVRNIGFLVSTRQLSNGRNRVAVDHIQQLGEAATFADPDSSRATKVFERPPLQLKVTVHHVSGANYPLSLYLNHFSGRDGIDSIAPSPFGWPTVSERVRVRRANQATLLNSFIRDQQTFEPNAKIIVLGDFNAFEFSDGYVDVMGTLKGSPAPANQVLTPTTSNLLAPMIGGETFITDPAERYSSLVVGTARTLEHVLISESIITGSTAVRVDHARINADFAASRYGDNSPVRVGERDPVRITIRVPAFRNADLSARILDVVPATPHVGSPVTFTVEVRNNGTSDAEFPAVSLITDAVLAYDIEAIAPAGWTCQAIVDPFLSYACTTPQLAAGESATITASIVVPAQLTDQTFSFATAARSQTPDSNVANNIDSRTIAPLAESDLSARWGGDLSLPLYSGSSRWLSFFVKNNGPDPNWRPNVTFTADAPTGSIEFYATYWNCNPDYSSATVKTHCEYGNYFPYGPFESGAETEFGVRVLAPLPDADGLNLVANVGGPGTDPNPTNNEAVLSLPLTLAKSDLSVKWTKKPKAPVFSGLISEFALTLNNAGPNPAQRSSLVITADAPKNEVILAAPAGWTCALDENDISRFVAECTNPDDAIAVGSNTVFNLQVRTPLPDANGLNLNATISTIGTDSNAANNSSRVSTPIKQANADLSAKWSGGPIGAYRPGDTAEYVLTLDNKGAQAAWTTSVTISVDAPFENVSFNDFGYWSCEADNSTLNFKIRCLYGIELAPRGQAPTGFVLNVVAPSGGINRLNLSATIDSAYIKDSNKGNNTAIRRQAISRPVE
jgi:uncharacterized protein